MTDTYALTSAAGDHPMVVPKKYYTLGPVTFSREGLRVFSENERASTGT